MNQVPRKGVWLRDELLHILTLSATLAGLCVTGVTLFHTMGNNAVRATSADDLLVTSAFLFLLCTYIIFFALRTKQGVLAVNLEKLADTLFLLALTGMVISGFVMLYTVL